MASRFGGITLTTFDACGMVGVHVQKGVFSFYEHGTPAQARALAAKLVADADEAEKRQAALDAGKGARQ